MRKFDEESRLRGTGRTTRQLKAAPPHAVYIVSNANMLSYTRELSRNLGRWDIEFMIYQPGWDMKCRGRRVHVVVDHWTAFSFEPHDMAMLSELNMRHGLEEKENEPR